jgi:WD40 repeat protein
VEAVAFTPDSRSFFTLTARSAKRWSVAGGEPQGTYEPGKGEAGRLMALAVSPDGKTLAVGGSSPFTGIAPGMIWLWDLPSGRLRSRLLHEEGGEVVSLAFSPDGKTLASGSQADGGVWLWDLATGKPRHQLAVSGVVWAVAFAPDGKTLASGGSDHTIRLWDPATGALLATLPEHEHLVLALAFSPDGRQLASGSYDRTLRLWNVAQRTVERRLDLGGWVHSVAYSPDGRTLAVGLRDQQSALRLLDLAPHG